MSISDTKRGTMRIKGKKARQRRNNDSFTIAEVFMYLISLV